VSRCQHEEEGTGNATEDSLSGSQAETVRMIRKAGGRYVDLGLRRLFGIGPGGNRPITHSGVLTLTGESVVKDDAHDESEPQAQRSQSKGGRHDFALVGRPNVGKQEHAPQRAHRYAAHVQETPTKKRQRTERVEGSMTAEQNQYVFSSIRPGSIDK